MNRGRPQVHPNGWAEHAKESKYHQNYYNDNKHIRINCPNCNKDVCKLTISSHMKSKACLKLAVASTDNH